MGLFGVPGHLFRKLDIPLAPMVLTVILGPMMEKAPRQPLEISRGSFEIFFTRPISVALLGVAAVFLLASTLRLASPVRGGAELQRGH
jgi:putative tricarboxylic transport membrane protein